MNYRTSAQQDLQRAHPKPCISICGVPRWNSLAEPKPKKNVGITPVFEISPRDEADSQARQPLSQKPRLTAQLLDGVLASQQLSRDDAESGEHRKAAVVQLPGAHVIIVLPKPRGVAEVARLLRWILGPNTQLQGTRNEEESDHAVAARRGQDRREPGRHLVEAGELDVVLHHSTQRRHHRHAPVLDLGGAEGAEAGLVALLAEARWVAH